jgi:hypothetical protein
MTMVTQCLVLRPGMRRSFSAKREDVIHLMDGKTIAWNGHKVESSLLCGGGVLCRSELSRL